MSETESLMLRILEGIQRDIAELKTDVGELKGDVAVLKIDVKDVKGAVADLTDYVQAGFVAIMRQNDRRFVDHEGRLRALENRRKSSSSEKPRR